MATSESDTRDTPQTRDHPSLSAAATRDADPGREELQLEASAPAGPQPFRVRFMERFRESWRIWLVSLVVVGIASAIFTGLGLEVWERESFSWDAPFMLAVHRAHSPWLDTLMVAVTRIGSPGEIIVTTVGILVLWWLGRRVGATALAVSVVGAGVLNYWLKLLFARPRPDVFAPLTPETSYSFPSGHTMSAVALYGFVAYLLWRGRHRVWAVAAVAFGLLIAFSRIYLGVHYPSDVVGAIAISGLWLGAVVLGYRHYKPSSGT